MPDALGIIAFQGSLGLWTCIPPDGPGGSWEAAPQKQRERNYCPPLPLPVCSGRVWLHVCLAESNNGTVMVRLAPGGEQYTFQEAAEIASNQIALGEASDSALCSEHLFPAAHQNLSLSFSPQLSQ